MKLVRAYPQIFGDHVVHANGAHQVTDLRGYNGYQQTECDSAQIKTGRDTNRDSTCRD